MKLLFILDPLPELKSAKDTSLAIMREAALRGHSLYVCEQHDLILRNEVVHLNANTFAFSDVAAGYVLGEAATFLPKAFDAIIMRKDPPFDNEYLYSTYLLELAVNQGARVLNNPTSVRSWNEKLSVVKFPQFSPAFLVTAKADLIRAFLAEHQDIVIKPLDGMGGSGIYRLTENDPNLGVILETATQLGSKTLMAQRYLPQISQGDKRIIIIDGKPVPYALARIPKAGETRGNLAAGGTGVAQPLSARDIEIATAVGKTLKQEGLFLVGLDVIGDYLTEINVTSPTGMVEITKQTMHLAEPCQPAKLFMQALETSAN
jgi:glutathione synthase